MNLREALQGVAGYRHPAGKGQAAQVWLDRIPRELQPLPFGYRIRTSGKAQTIPVIPWIALLREDITTTAQEGLYLVYLFDAQIETVYLSMNQGVTQHERNARERGLKGRAAEQAAIEEIRGDTESMRQILAPPETELDISLRSDRRLALAYEAGSISAIRYSMQALPSNHALTTDLDRYMDLYSTCVSLKDQLAANQTVKTSARAKNLAPAAHAPPVFRPKNADEYLARIAPHLQKRTRTHEALVRRFGESMREQGLTPATNVHPRDLTLDGYGDHWLVEMKTTTGGVEQAVRDAISQLFAYRHFVYRNQGRDDPRLLAVFDGPIGDAFTDLLESLDIGAMWVEGSRWGSSASAAPLTRSMRSAPDSSPPSLATDATHKDASTAD